MSNTPGWHKSSYSNGNNNNCVEVAEEAEVVSVRDTQNRDLGTIDFSPVAWAAFLREVKSGRL